MLAIRGDEKLWARQGKAPRQVMAYGWRSRLTNQAGPGAVRATEPRVPGATAGHGGDAAPLRQPGRGYCLGALSPNPMSAGGSTMSNV